MSDESGSAPSVARTTTRRGWLEAGLWIAGAGTILFLLRPSASGPKVGSQVALPSLVSLESGERVALGTPGRPVLIEVFASWCTACRRSSAMLSELKNGPLDFVMVSVDERIEDARKAKASWPITARVLHDSRGELHRKFDIRMLPTFVLLDEQGVVKRVTNGTPGALDLHAYAEIARQTATR